MALIENSLGYLSRACRDFNELVARDAFQDPTTRKCAQLLKQDLIDFKDYLTGEREELQKKWK